MADISMCDDRECPSRLKCYRFIALPSEWTQSYEMFERPPLADKCDDFLAANCCETSKREWGPGDYTGSEADCLFCNRTHQWDGKVWKGVYP